MMLGLRSTNASSTCIGVNPCGWATARTASLFTSPRRNAPAWASGQYAITGMRRSAKPRQQIYFNAARTQMIQHLIHATVRVIGNLQKLTHVIEVKVRNAPSANQPVRHRRFHTFRGLLEWNRATPVQQIHVQIISAKTLQTVFQATAQMSAPGIVRIHLEYQIQWYTGIRHIFRASHHGTIAAQPPQDRHEAAAQHPTPKNKQGPGPPSEAKQVRKNRPHSTAIT